MPHTMQRSSRFADASALGRVRLLCKPRHSETAVGALPGHFLAGHKLSLTTPRQATHINATFSFVHSQARPRAGGVCHACKQRRVRGAGGRVHHRPAWLEQHGVQLLRSSPGGAGCGVRCHCHVSSCSTGRSASCFSTYSSRAQPPRQPSLPSCCRYTPTGQPVPYYSTGWVAPAAEM